MPLPIFYITSYDKDQTVMTLEENSSRHIIQVLRMRPGEDIQLTDGKGALLTATILDDHKKKCRVQIGAIVMQPPPARTVTIAISPLKNASRFEWFLEKATEIGVATIIPLLCERTERQHHRPDRWQSILISALLQSQQTWLPRLGNPTGFPNVIAEINKPEGRVEQRLIAHCLAVPRPTISLSGLVRTQSSLSSLILIGPEGDFSLQELEAALANNFTPVTLGNNRLRTETAGIVAATLLCI